MIDFFKTLFSADAFMPHGHCYLWRPGVLALHISSDALIALAYYSIPFTLIYFIRKRRDLPFNWMFLCFAAFIVFCGTTHLMEIWVIWHPTYWLSGAIKGLTALVSVPTAILLVRLVPQALALPSPAALSVANAELAREVAERTRAEAEARRLNEELERRVAERTRQLEEANEILKRDAERTRWLASFPEQNPNPIVELDFATGTIHYQNLAATKLFRDLHESGLDHPFLAGMRVVNEALRIGGGRPLHREIALNNEHYAQTICYVPDNRRLRIYGTDITELKQAEAQLRTDIAERQRAQEAQERLAAIVNSSEDAIIGKTLAGVITDWNPGAEALFGYPSAEAVGKFMTLTFPPELLPEEEAILARVGRGESIKHYETLRVRKDGTRFDVSVTVSPIRDRTGKITGASTVARDVTEAKRAAAEILKLNGELEMRVARRTAELETANKELEAFSYSVSHDLRAPLRAVNGFAGIVLEDYGPKLPAEARGYLERIRTGGRQMGTLIDDLLSFARLGRQPLNRQLVDFNQVVQAALAELGPATAGRPKELRVADLPPANGDPALLKQVWINLLSNAAKYSRDRQPAVIEVGCEQNNGESIYFVRDNGVGFDMQYAGKLFGVFQRLHRLDEFEGTGVGLAIVHRVVERHGGRVWAEAKLGEGATFFFTLAGQK